VKDADLKRSGKVKIVSFFLLLTLSVPFALAFGEVVTGVADLSAYIKAFVGVPLIFFDDLRCGERHPGLSYHREIAGNR
jgi:hypothetical protein